MDLSAAAAIIRSHKIYFAASICTVGGVILYNYLKGRGYDGSSSGLASQIKLHTKPHEEKLIVESEHIPKLLEIIHNIEQRTNTKISFYDESTSPPNRGNGDCLPSPPDFLKSFLFKKKDQGDEKAIAKQKNSNDSTNREMTSKCSYQLVTINGMFDDVKDARYMLLQAIEKMSVVREEISFSMDVYQHFYGNECEIVQELNRLTASSVETSILLERDTRRLRVFVSGNRQQVNVARRLIEATIKNWGTERLTEGPHESTTRLSEIPALTLEPIEETPENNCFYEVIVSAIASPSKFWIQLAKNRDTQLDALMMAMMTFYVNTENRRNLQIKTPQIGQLVAAFFPGDNRWYRAEIIGIIKGKTGTSTDFRYDLFFVDFGNSEFIMPCYVFQLPDHFKVLSYQAAECFLVNVISLNSNKPETWDEDSISYFEKITDNVDGRKIICQVMTNKTRMCKEKNINVAGVELYFTGEEMVVNIGKMLISSGYAKQASKQYSTAHDAEMLNSFNPLFNDKNSKNYKNISCIRSQNNMMIDSNKQDNSSAAITSSEARATKRTSTWHDESYVTTMSTNASGEGDTYFRNLLNTC